MKEKLRMVFRIVTNKFLVTGVLFAVWMIYFDQNNWAAQQARNKQLTDTKQNIEYLTEEIAGMEKEHYEMTHNPERLEKYAREQFKMKRDGEDLYIMEQ